MLLPFPRRVPKAMARLHEVLELFAEEAGGFFIAELGGRSASDRELPPLLIYVTPAHCAEGPTGPGRRPPDWIGEVLLEPGQLPTRLPRYASAGVAEYWVIDLTPAGPWIEVHTEPRKDGTYAAKRRFGPGDAVESAAFQGLTLRPGDLVREGQEG